MDTVHHFAASGDLDALENALKGSGLRKKNKVPVDEPDAKGNTALHVASGKGQLAAAQLLCKHGAQVNARNHAQRGALHVAAEAGQMEMADFLVAQGADVNLQDKSMNTALHYAAARGHLEIVDRLTDAGASTEVHNKHGDTPLHTAVREGNYCVMLLVSKGANMEARTADGLTALLLAISCVHKAVAHVLMEKGADLHAETPSGESLVTLVAGEASNIPPDQRPVWENMFGLVYE